jgi:hypothetical protein
MTNCNLVPYVTKPLPKSYFEANTPSFVLQNDKVLAEVYDNAVYTFRKYVSKPSNRTLVYRDEYTAYVFQPYASWADHSNFNLFSANYDFLQMASN